MNNLIPSLLLIRGVLVKRVLVFNGFFLLFSVVIGRPIWVLSSLFGSFFSFLIFSHLLLSQSSILRTKKKQMAFIFYFFRLAIYAVPIVLGLAFKNYFNFIIILVFLFSFQMHYVVLELFKNLKRYKRRKKQWTN